MKSVVSLINAAAKMAVLASPYRKEDGEWVTGEHALWAGVISAAVQDLRFCEAIRPPRCSETKARIGDESLDFLLSEDDAGIFCEVIGINWERLSEQVRKLIKMLEAGLASGHVIH